MKNGSFQGREVVIVEAARTPIGRGHEEGLLQGRPRQQPLGEDLQRRDRARRDRSRRRRGRDRGCAQQFGEQGINIARNAWLEAGLPIETPATTVDRQCGSAQQAVNFGAALVASGVADTVIGGGWSTWATSRSPTAWR